MPNFSKHLANQGPGGPRDRIDGRGAGHHRTKARGGTNPAAGRRLAKRERTDFDYRPRKSFHVRQPRLPRELWLRGSGDPGKNAAFPLLAKQHAGTVRSYFSFDPARWLER